jgi:hypothetical protein
MHAPLEADVQAENRSARGVGSLSTSLETAAGESFRDRAAGLNG